MCPTQESSEEESHPDGLPPREEMIAEQDAEAINALGILKFLRVFSRDELRQAIIQDSEIPQGLRTLIQDDDFWMTFKPSGSEIYATMQKYGMFINGKAEDFSEALRTIRRFLSA